MFVANDNDFLPTIADPRKQAGDPTRGSIENPNQFYVFAFDEADLPSGVRFLAMRPPASRDAI